MPHGDDSQPFDRVVDDLVSEAGRTAAAFDWALGPSDILETSRRSRSKHAREGVGLVLVAAVLVAIFVAPLPQLHLFHRGGTPPPATGLSHTYESLAISSDLVPPPRGGTVMAYFPPGNEVVLFGGFGSGDHGWSDYSLNDTWVFDRHGWRALHPATSPPARRQAAMAYDPQLGELVLYGGCSFCGAPGYTVVQDTWAFDGSNWHELHSSRLPTYEPSPQLSWDTATSALELLAPPPGYGANPPTGNFDADPHVPLGRWSWQPSGWTWEGSAKGPPLVIQKPAFVSEPGSTEMLYYSYQPYSGSCTTGPPADCGSDPTGLTYSQTWTWNGRAFVQNHPRRAPSSSQLVVADTRVDQVVAIAGSELWGWNGATWQVLSSDVPSTANVVAAYDPLLGDAVIFGETATGSASTTWVWNGTTWLSATRPQPAPTGEVTGFIDPCEGIAISGAPFAAGTVTVLRGRQTMRETAPGQYQVVLPRTIVGREHVGKNRSFDFVLAPGNYVLEATFAAGGNARGLLDVRISAGATLRQNIPNLCK